MIKSNFINFEDFPKDSLIIGDKFVFILPKYKEWFGSSEADIPMVTSIMGDGVIKIAGMTIKKTEDTKLVSDIL